MSESSSDPTSDFHFDYAELSDVRLHYASAGEGELLLFIHGFPEFWYEWRVQLAHFGASRRAVAPDLRGYNLSSRPSELSAYTPERLAKDIQELVVHLGHERCSVVAHDWGGFVASYFAHFYPESINKLVLINSCNPTQWWRGFTSLPAQIEASQYILAFRSEGIEDMLSADGYAPFIEQVFRDASGKSVLSDEERKKYLEAWSREGGLTGGLNYYRALPFGPPTLDADADAALPDVEASMRDFDISAPTRIIWGDADDALRKELLEIQPELFAELDIALVPGASHWVIHERPDEVNRLIGEFLYR